jgi:hypothetical protein
MRTQDDLDALLRRLTIATPDYLHTGAEHRELKFLSVADQTSTSKRKNV